MARLQLIFPLILWALWRATDQPGHLTAFGPSPFGPAWGAALYATGLAGLVAFVFVVARSVMRRTSLARPSPVPRFHRMLFLARWAAVAWHATALWSLGYGEFMAAWVPDFDRRFEVLPAFASVVPLAAAWVLMIVAQYPIDRGVREQNALYALEFGEPVRPTPTRWQYVGHAVRSQVLFTLAPLLTLGLVRDGLTAAGVAAGVEPSRAQNAGNGAALVGVFVLAPELLRRVLPTVRLAASPVRERLSAMAKRLRLGVREILVWRTHHSVGNAAVMGLVPGVRYVMLTDLLLDSMPLDEVEAVFAHEAGHVKHKHLAWYAVYWMGVVVALDVVTGPAQEWAARNGVAGEVTVEAVVVMAGLVVALVGFGAVSRRFERQADAFACRNVTLGGPAAVDPRTGAAVFASALRHVARMNNLPLDERSMTAGLSLPGRLIGRLAHHAATWMHGSIRSRIDHVTTLAADDDAAGRFEWSMAMTRLTLVVGLAAAVVAAAKLG